MASFSEEYRAFKHWQTEDRTPEDYELHLKLKSFLNDFTQAVDADMTRSDKWDYVFTCWERYELD